MNILNATAARQQFAELLNTVRYSGRPVIIGRHDKPEVVLIKFPDMVNSQLDDVTNLNASSGGFDWLAEEPELYSRTDLQ